MSLPKNLHQAERWLLTAREDLQAAETLAAAEMHAQSCFLAQQSGEKALKEFLGGVGHGKYRRFSQETRTSTCATSGSR